MRSLVFAYAATVTTLYTDNTDYSAVCTDYCEKKCETNDFYGMSVVYGIEAGRNIVLNELENLFKMQNIEVGFRYLNLIADYMTRLGTFRGFSRKNISEESHIQRITYETALSFLIEASLNKIDDNLSTVSGSLIFANPCKLGTGIVNLF